jgi:cytochrome c oxidase cbb3-type subunit 3
VTRAHLILPVLGMLAISTVACNGLPGRPRSGLEALRPDEVMNFKLLYGKNCAACHGPEGQGGPAISLADPIYLAIVSDSTLRNVIANGVEGTAMPPFAQSSGGMLTDRQIEALADGIRCWAKPSTLAGVQPPPYSASVTGDAARGAAAYNTFCASCHGPGGKGSKKAGSIVDPSFLALISNQALRTFVIVGNPKLGAPDWRGDALGRPLTDQDVTDVVAWLAAQRVQFPGQPYPNAMADHAQGGNP